MGQVIELDSVRLHRTGQRFIRGLHFAETGIALPPGACVKVGTKMDLRASDRDVLEIAKAFAALPERRDGSVGGAFSYVAGFAPGRCSVWFMLVYDFFFWLGTVDWAALEHVKAAD